MWQPKSESLPRECRQRRVDSQPAHLVPPWQKRTGGRLLASWWYLTFASHAFASLFVVWRPLGKCRPGGVVGKERTRMLEQACAWIDSASLDDNHQWINQGWACLARNPDPYLVAPAPAGTRLVRLWPGLRFEGATVPQEYDRIWSQTTAHSCVSLAWSAIVRSRCKNSWTMRWE